MCTYIDISHHLLRAPFSLVSAIFMLSNTRALCSLISGVFLVPCAFSGDDTLDIFRIGRTRPDMPFEALFGFEVVAPASLAEVRSHYDSVSRDERRARAVNAIFTTS